MATKSVTLRNVSGDALAVYAPDGVVDSFHVGDGEPVTLPGMVVLDEDDDRYLIGPPGAPLTVEVDGVEASASTDPNPDVRAWAKATWSLVTTTDRKSTTEEKENTDA